MTLDRQGFADRATMRAYDAARAGDGMVMHMDSSSLVVIAAIILAYAAVSRRLEGTSITAPIVFVTAGLLFGVKRLDCLHLHPRPGLSDFLCRRS
jgi:hypothetical protein